jgi:hypothetical protein
MKIGVFSMMLVLYMVDGTTERWHVITSYLDLETGTESFWAQRLDMPHDENVIDPENDPHIDSWEAVREEK